MEIPLRKAMFLPFRRWPEPMPAKTLKVPLSDGIMSAWAATSAEQAMAIRNVTLKQEVDAFDIEYSFLATTTAGTDMFNELPRG